MFIVSLGNDDVVMFKRQKAKKNKKKKNKKKKKKKKNRFIFDDSPSDTTDILKIAQIRSHENLFYSLGFCKRFDFSKRSILLHSHTLKKETCRVVEQFPFLLNKNKNYNSLFIVISLFYKPCNMRTCT